jgi:hypothetical protein
MTSQLTVTGVKEIDKVLSGMPKELSHRVFQRANAEAAKVLVNKAKLLAPEGPTGRTIDSIGTVKPNIKRSDELGLVLTGPRRGRYGGAAAHLIEYGTVKRSNKRGANRGRVLGKPFMQPAYDQTKDLIFNDINRIIGKKLLAFMNRTIKK